MYQSPANNTPNARFTKSFWKVLVLLTAAVCIAATAAHFYLKSSADNATGPLSVLNHFFDLVVALFVSFVILCVGHTLVKRFKLQFTTQAESLSFSFFLGTGVVALLVLFIGLVGLLRGWTIIGLLVLCLTLTVRDLPELFQRVKQSSRTAFATSQSRIISSVFFGLMALLILRALTPPHTADELIYHLPVPQQFVQAGRVFPSYDNSLGNVPFLIHMIYVVCLMAGSDIAAKLFSLFLAITTAISLYAFCNRYLTRGVGKISLFAFFAAGMIVELGVSARIDVSLAGMLFACTFAMINYLTTRVRAWLWLSALFGGFSLGIKHTAALWIFFVGILYLVETFRSRESAGRILTRGVLYTLIALAVASPWYIKNAVWFHNPLYPFVTGEVAEFGENGVRYFNVDDERKLDAHFSVAQKEIPTIVAEQEQELRVAAISRLERHPMRLWEFFFKPNTYLMAEPNQFPNYLFLITPLVIFLKPGKWIWWLLGLSLAFVFSVTFTSWIARYLVPAYPALTIVAAYTLSILATRFESLNAIGRRIPGYALAVALVPILTACTYSMKYFHSLDYLAGLISRQTFLVRLSPFRPINFINHELPPTARVLTVGAQMTYGLQRPYLSDESWFSTKWRRLLVRNDSLESVNRQLKAQGFTHVLYSDSLSIFAAQMGVEGTGGMSLISQPEDGTVRRTAEYPLLRNWSTFTLYKERFLEPVYSDKNGFEILRIK
ncbi:MAG TPA: hypothetical protein VGD61_01535 [Pyrinomonadaceae bacterium]